MSQTPTEPLRERYEYAVKNLTILRKDYATDAVDHIRLGGKIEGIKLALSYLDEAVRSVGEAPPPPAPDGETVTPERL